MTARAEKEALEAAEAARDSLKAELAEALGVMRRADKSLSEHLPHDGQSRAEMRAFIARHQKETGE